MRSTVCRLVTNCFLTVIVGLAGSAADAQEPFTLPTQELTSWMEQLTVPGSQLQQAALNRLFLTTGEIQPFSGRSVVGLGINGHVEFTSSRSLVRIVAVDDQLREYLVYEAYPLIAPADSFDIRNACRETCVLPPSVPAALKVELVDASVRIRTIVTVAPPTSGERAAQTAQRVQDVKAAQESEIIEVLNRQIEAHGLNWIAGETPMSRLSFAEKKELLACAAAPPDAVPNLQGAEYYTGGIFEVETEQSAASITQQPSALIDSFDWRSRHGANRPGSPYYDGDAAGSGWMTSVKTQLCAECWAHSALGATETLANLYFNQHLDLDLSEQELVSCILFGGCQGGNTGNALNYLQRVGVVDEACFPESGMDEPCGNCCTTPQERVMLAGYEDVFPELGEDNIKRKLITSGPLPFGIISWWHAMVLTGYTTEPGTGNTLWLVKNSWGSGWGDNGYMYVKVSLNDIYLTYNLRTPVVSLVTPYAIVCRDADEDGYFNWGISSDGTSACRSAQPIEDCDDSDPTLAIMTDDGRCTAPTSVRQQPFGRSRHSIPGTLEAEDYDLGGARVAYRDTTETNVGGQYRTDGVDIWYSGAAEVQYYVGAIATGEWLEYSVSVETAGQYSLAFRVATPNAGRKLHVELDGQNVTGTITLPNTGSYSTWQSVTAKASVRKGPHVLRVMVESGGFNLNRIDISKDLMTPALIPGTLQAEDFRAGGEGVAYHDTGKANLGRKYRPEGVDIWYAGADDVEHYVGAIATGEWLEYAVNVETAGQYSLAFRVATPNAGRKLHVELDGQNVTGTITLPSTGSYSAWQSVTAKANLSKGSHALRVVVELGGFNLNRIDISKDLMTPALIPGTLEAEDFRAGGEGVAYHDTSESNVGGQYRADGVDIWYSGAAEVQYYVGAIATGEWLEYAVNVETAGQYSLAFRVATPNAGRKLHVELDGQNVTGTITLPNTGSYSAWQSVTAKANLSKGSHALRVVVESGGFNFNRIDIVRARW